MANDFMTEGDRRAFAARTRTPEALAYERGRKEALADLAQREKDAERRGYARGIEEAGRLDNERAGYERALVDASEYLKAWRNDGGDSRYVSGYNDIVDEMVGSVRDLSWEDRALRPGEKK